jgi:hypothetical protein
MIPSFRFLLLGLFLPCAVAFGLAQDKVDPVWKVKKGEKLTVKFSGKLHMKVDGGDSIDLTYSGTASMGAEEVMGDTITGMIDVVALKMNGRYRQFPADLDFKKGKPPKKGAPPAVGKGPKAERVGRPNKEEGKPSMEIKKIEGVQDIGVYPMRFTISRGEVSFNTTQLKFAGSHLVVKYVLTDLWSGMPRSPVTPGDTWQTTVKVPCVTENYVLAWKEEKVLAESLDTLRSVQREKCFVFEQEIKSNRRAKNKIEMTRTVAFSPEDGRCVEFKEKGETRIKDPERGLAKGEVRFERIVRVQR